jgi:hypothetical protein
LRSLIDHCMHVHVGMGDYEHAVEVELGITEGWEDNSSRADDGLVTLNCVPLPLTGNKQNARYKDRSLSFNGLTIHLRK